MSDGHKTSSIKRPADPSRAIAAKPVERQLVTGRGKRLLGFLAGLVILTALGAALFVLPLRGWSKQRDDLARKQHTLDVLTEANARLAADVNRLQSDDGIKQAARQEIDYVDNGEQRYTVLPEPQAPLALPLGWPFDTVAQIIAVRAQPTPSP